MSNQVIETTGLTKFFRKRRVVDNLSIRVSYGDVYGFLGPNGAGKSTTIRMLVGLIRPNRGSAVLLGNDITRNRIGALKYVGALVESPSFYKFLTARQNLRLLSRLSGTCDDRRIDEVLDTVGLLDRANDKVKTFSHGMCQRLGIAQALLPNPKLVILDEPTSGLDPQGMKEVRELIKRLAQDRKVTIFLSSHLLYEVEQICTKVGIINQGRLIAEGDVDNLLNREMNLIEFKVGSGLRAQDVLNQSSQVEIISVSNDSLIVRTHHKYVPELNRALVASGIDVFSIIPQRVSLEDFFLDIIRSDGNADQNSDRANEVKP
ncbi:MAG: ABC transporter ATP-binding protein [Armatimonadota bacterium]|nr:ABC transporter ATP-binding protein [Armatimonadota bacterium]